MSKLYFSYGRGESFTSIKLANKKDGYSYPIRELMQNSLDASREAGNGKCIIDIYIEKINKNDVPNIGDYEKALENSISLLKSRNGYTSGNKQIVESIEKELEKDSIDVLMFVDNGTGMDYDKLGNLLDEISNHANENAGGSYGVGHLSSYHLSSLRYVLYATKYNQNNQIENLFTGSTILAGHEDKGSLRGSKGRIIAKVPKNETNPKFEYPTIFPKFIQLIMDKLETTGSMVAILGLNEQWNNDAEYAIASNFFHAISHGKLEVNIHQNNELTKIDDKKLESLLSSKKDESTARDAILSGKNTYQAYQAVQERQSKKTIKLESKDIIYIYNANKIESSSCICLVRNGMLIARHDNMLSTHISNLRKNEDFESFMVVIDVDKEDSKNLFRLIRNAENTEHNKLINKIESPAEDKKNIKKLFEELSEEIKCFLKPRDRNGSLVEMDLLEIPNKAEVQGSNTTRPRSQMLKAKPSANKSKPPISRIRTTDNSKKRPAPEIVSRSLEAKNSMRMKDKGNTIDVELNIVPQKMEVKDEVYLSMSLAQDKDNDESGRALDFVSLSIDGVDIEIPDFIEIEKDGVIEKIDANKDQIKLGKLLEKQAYKVIATIEKPKNVKGVGVALKPFLGLKRRSK